MSWHRMCSASLGQKLSQQSVIYHYFAIIVSCIMYLWIYLCILNVINIKLKLRQKIFIYIYFCDLNCHQIPGTWTRNILKHFKWSLPFSHIWSNVTHWHIWPFAPFLYSNLHNEFFNDKQRCICIVKVLRFDGAEFDFSE
jgi:hypothetical protein